MARSTPAHRPTIGESARFGLGHCPPFTRATCETPERSPRAVRQPPHTADRWPPAPVSLASQPEGMGPRGRITGRGSSQLPASCHGVCPMIDETLPRSAGHAPLIDLRRRSSGWGAPSPQPAPHEGHLHANPGPMEGTFTPTYRVKVPFMRWKWRRWLLRRVGVVGGRLAGTGRPASTGRLARGRRLRCGRLCGRWSTYARWTCGR